MTKYLPTIGLEIHAELRTKTKMFCNSKNDADETRPNVNICPVCLAHPGTLPVINKEAVKHVLKLGLSLGGKLADYTEFDRKNYFYPDLPKGYQISQYEYPLVSGGELSGVAITRIHLEEDTASSIHDENTNVTTIDFNRSGVALMELVTEPVIHSAQEAGNFARELQLLLRYLGVSNANMEKGEMRVEANISLGLNGQLGTKVEIKNLNSFRIMERAIAYEIKRQTKLLDRGEKVIQETLGWDEAKQSTFPQRIKEGSADYRYFPDPDLPSLKLSEVSDFRCDVLDRDMPELPLGRRLRYLSLGIKADDVELFVRDPRLGIFFDEVVKLLGQEELQAIVLASNYITNDLVRIIRDIEQRDAEYQYEIPISPRNFKIIIDLVHSNKISSRGAKDLVKLCALSETDPMQIATEQRLLLDSDSAGLESAINDVLLKNATVVEDFRAGKTVALEYLVGQTMRVTRGASDPHEIRRFIMGKI